MYMCFKSLLSANSHMSIPRPIGRLAVWPTRLEGQVCRQTWRYCGSNTSLGVLGGWSGGFAGLVVDFCVQLFRDMYRGVSQKGCLFVWYVSNTQGIVRRVCEILSVESLPKCGDPGSRSRRQKG